MKGLDYQTREAAWAIVHESKMLNDSGHAPLVRWARAALELDDVLTANPKRRHVGHTHGFALVGDVWTCAQDFFAAGDQPESGCGLTWEPPHVAVEPQGDTWPLTTSERTTP